MAQLACPESRATRHPCPMTYTILNPLCLRSFQILRRCEITNFFFAMQRNPRIRFPNILACRWEQHRTFAISCLKSGGQLMDAAAKFRKYAADCNRMAKVSDDPETQGLWERMAERWLLCAKLAKEEEQSVAQTRAQRASRHGPSHRSWLG